jgi:ketosteroid isomerase-like protein
MRVAIVGCLILLATSLVLAQYGSPGGGDEGRILSLENAKRQAKEHKDTKALDDLFADTAVYTDDDGTFMTKGEFLKNVASPANHPEQIVIEAVTVHSYGVTAIATGLYREKGSLNGKPYQHRGRFTDTWISQNGVWQCVASQSTLMPAK